MSATSEVFVPGRLCILGEHTDWAGEYRRINPSIAVGMTIVCATNEGLYARCSYHPEGIKFKYQFLDPLSNQINCTESSLDETVFAEKANENDFFCYAYGTACAVLQSISDADQRQSILRNGIMIDNYKTTLPMKKGLSSSAAICVLIATAFNVVYNLKYERKDIMELAYQGEMMTKSKCGRMDQCVAMGSGSVGLMFFDENGCQLKLLSCPTALYFVVADLKAGKNTVKILQSLNDCFPFPLDSTQSRLHRYAAYNIKLSWAAVNAIEKGDLGALGDVIAEAQLIFDDSCIENCPSELTSPKLHSLMNNEKLKSISIAIKGVGSQGDGSVQILCADEDHQRKVVELLNNELNCEAFTLTVPPNKVSPERPLLSHHRIKCALVVADSRIGRHFQALGSHCPPSLLPIPWSSGARSILISLLLDLISCGVQRIAVVVTASTSDVSKQLSSPAPVLKNAGRHGSVFGVGLNEAASNTNPPSNGSWKYLSSLLYNDEASDELFEDSDEEEEVRVVTDKTIDLKPSDQKSYEKPPKAPNSKPSDATMKAENEHIEDDHNKDGGITSLNDSTLSSRMKRIERKIRKSTTWSYNKEEFETLKQRVRFFFEDQINSFSRYTAYSQATEALVMAGNKLTIARGQSFRHSASQTPNLTPTNNGKEPNLRIDDFALGPLLLCRAEIWPQSFPPPLHKVGNLSQGRKTDSTENIAKHANVIHISSGLSGFFQAGLNYCSSLGGQPLNKPFINLSTIRPKPERLNRPITGHSPHQDVLQVTVNPTASSTNDLIGNTNNYADVSINYNGMLMTDKTYNCFGGLALVSTNNLFQLLKTKEAEDYDLKHTQALPTIHDSKRDQHEADTNQQENESLEPLIHAADLLLWHLTHPPKAPSSLSPRFVAMEKRSATINELMKRRGSSSMQTKESDANMASNADGNGESSTNKTASSQSTIGSMIRSLSITGANIINGNKSAHKNWIWPEENQEDTNAHDDKAHGNHSKGTKYEAINKNDQEQVENKLEDGRKPHTDDQVEKKLLSDQLKVEMKPLTNPNHNPYQHMIGHAHGIYMSGILSTLDEDSYRDVCAYALSSPSS